MCRIAAIGDLVTHTRPQLECSAVTKFGIEFSLDNIQYMSEIAPVIRRIASAIFDQAHPQIADGEGAPGGLSRLTEMDGWWNSGPVRHRKWQCRDFHAVTAGFSFADHRAVCRLLEALRHQANPADRGRTLIEPDQGVGNIGFLE